ncbi:rCG41446 [Rattus norvegicus]|uniref:RCG41446 n=1 Tax=Rattus norvegicus TaxID=10116 RepID=A6II16_RAT|nr:rCG41446 [Rattus norvegicus]
MFLQSSPQNSNLPYPNHLSSQFPAQVPGAPFSSPLVGQAFISWCMATSAASSTVPFNPAYDQEL